MDRQREAVLKRKREAFARYVAKDKEAYRKYINAYRKRNKENSKAYREKNKEKFNAYQREYARTHKSGNETAVAYKSYAKYPEKRAARLQVMLAKQKGILKERPCEVCFEFPTQAHHDDYTKPLEVRWLCGIHHKEHHYKLRQEILV